MSRVVPIVIIVVGALTLAVVLIVVGQSRSIFAVAPQAPPLRTTVWAKGFGSAAQAAERARDRARSRAVGFLRRRGFSEGQIAPRVPLVDFFDKAHHQYEADQLIDVSSDTYPVLARSMNAIDFGPGPSGELLSGTFPRPPFLALAVCASVFFVVLLSIAVAALETREADVSRAPSGMHPFFVVVQTLLIGVLFILAVIDAHLLLPASRLPFAFVSVLGIGMLVYWLGNTRSRWQQSPFLRRAYVGYVAGVGGVVAAVIVALHVQLT